MAISNLQKSEHFTKTAQMQKAKTFHANIYKLARENAHFRKVLETGEHSQVVLMTIRPHEDIGEEVHKVDQILIFVAGTGAAIINGERFDINPDDLVFVKAGATHNFINTGQEELKLFTIYAPAEHKPNTVEETKSTYH